MYNSTIRQKKCKCGCNLYPTIGFNGYYRNHAPQDVIDAYNERKRPMKERKKQRSTKLNDFFQEQRKHMTGVCQNCGGKTQKENDLFYKFCIAHILPKRLFHSIEEDGDNWLELCMDCHSKFDSSWSEAAKMPVFELAKERFQAFKDKITKDELWHIPEQIKMSH